MKSLIWILLLFQISCTHAVSLRESHFATPLTSSHPWGGSVAASFNGVTNVTLIENTATNPPTRGTARINKDVTLTDLLFLSNIGIDAALSPYPSLDLFYESPLAGFNWQFLNHNPAVHQWVGALRGAYGLWKSSSSSSDSTNGNITSDSDITTAYAGVSLGYKAYPNLIPYYSYVYEIHDTNTKVVNQYGSFPGFQDQGLHSIQSIGFTTEGPGLLFVMEYSMIFMKWTQNIINSSAIEGYQNTVGVKLGYGW